MPLPPPLEFNIGIAEQEHRLILASLSNTLSHPDHGELRYQNFLVTAILVAVKAAITRKGKEILGTDQSSTIDLQTNMFSSLMQDFNLVNLPKYKFNSSRSVSAYSQEIEDHVDLYSINRQQAFQVMKLSLRGESNQWFDTIGLPTIDTIKTTFAKNI